MSSMEILEILTKILVILLLLSEFIPKAQEAVASIHEAIQRFRRK